MADGAVKLWPAGITETTHSRPSGGTRQPLQRRDRGSRGPGLLRPNVKGTVERTNRLLLAPAAALPGPAHLRVGLLDRPVPRQVQPFEVQVFHLEFLDQSVVGIHTIP